MKKIFLILLIFSFLNASFLWEKHVSGEVKAIHFNQNDLYVGTELGNLYDLEPNSGSIKWKMELNDSVKKIIYNKGSLVVISNKHLFIIKNTKIFKKINLSIVFGGDGNDKGIFLINSSKIIGFDYDGNKLWEKGVGENNSSITVASYPHLTNNIIVNINNNTYFYDYNGNLIKKVKSFEIAGSMPLYRFNNLFIPAYDGNIYIINNLKIKRIRTKGLIKTIPSLFNGFVYIGGDDGVLYKINSYDGKIEWSFNGGEPIKEIKTKTTIIGDNIFILFGNKVIIIDEDGNKKFETIGSEKTSSLDVEFDTIYYGDIGGVVYGYKLNRGCGFDEKNIRIGYAPYQINGTVFSRYGNKEVYIRIDNKTWEKANVINDKWLYIIDPNKYAEGPLVVECKVKDALGEDKEKFNYIIGYRDLSLPKMKMNISMNTTINKGEEMEIKVYYKNNLLNDFILEYDNKTIHGYGIVRIKFDKGGKHELIFKKTGFEEEKRIVNVNDNTPIILGVFLIIILIGAGVWWIKKH